MDGKGVDWVVHYLKKKLTKWGKFDNKLLQINVPLIFSNKDRPPMKAIPPRHPVTKAAHDSKQQQPAQIAAIPATAPLTIVK